MPAHVTPTPILDPPDLTSRQILAYDPTGDGRLVEAVGDLATATHIAIIVPGADTTVWNFDRGHGGVLRRSPAWQARQLHDASNRTVPVIAWLGYDPPEGIGLAAARSERAEAGANELVHFVDDLAHDHPGATITVIGHSYGSVVLGHAASRLPPQVTELVAIGSPGMDASTAIELHATARIWAGAAPNDWTRRLPDVRFLGTGHATNPADQSFGATPLDVTTTDGHDGYFVAGTSSLSALAEVAAGCAADPGERPMLRPITMATRSAASSCR
jgi:pimeloyl-ACP methyl ester carboxylesterase